MFAHGTTVLCNMLMEHDTVADKRLEIVTLRGVFNFLHTTLLYNTVCWDNSVMQMCAGWHDSVVHLGATLSCPSLGCPPGPEKFAEANLTLSKPNT